MKKSGKKFVGFGKVTTFAVPFGENGIFYEFFDNTERLKVQASTGSCCNNFKFTSVSFFIETVFAKSFFLKTRRTIVEDRSNLGVVRTGNRVRRSIQEKGLQKCQGQAKHYRIYNEEFDPGSG